MTHSNITQQDDYANEWIAQEDYEELLDYFRTSLCKNMSDEAIVKLAYDYKYPPLACVDVVDVVSCLSVPGDKFILSTSISAQDGFNVALVNLFDQVSIQGVNLSSAESIMVNILMNEQLCFIKHYYDALDKIKKACHPDVQKFLSVRFGDNPSGYHVTLILSGIKTL
jgi:cell division GTPase FtsZ